MNGSTPLVRWLVSIVCLAASCRSSGTEAADRPSPTELRAYAAEAENELRGNILPFWLKHARDRERGGFHGQIGQDMHVAREAPRGVLLTSRILWTFSAAQRQYPSPEYLEMAQWALRDLLDRGWDPMHGGLFWSVSPDGKPVEDMKHIYVQAFGIYGLSEYHRTTGDKAALERSIALYRLIEGKARDRQHGGYFEAFTRDWKRHDAGQRIMGARLPKSQNTHIHILEAYTNLYRVWKDDALRTDLRALLDIMLTRIIDAKKHHLILFFTPDWKPASEEISYGHDIELSWLVVEAAEVLGDEPLLGRVRAAALPMAKVTYEEGIGIDGGVLNERGSHGLSNTNRDWWPQAEGAVGFLNAYQISGDTRYYTASRRTWNFALSRFVDRTHGGWYEAVAENGNPLPGRNKLSQWKCPYHNSRACLQLIERLETLAK